MEGHKLWQCVACMISHLVATARPCASSLFDVLLWQMRALVDMEGSGLVPMLQQDKYEDLGRMYTLFRRVEGGLDLMRSVLGDHIKDTGRALINDPERTKDPVDFVHKLLEEKDKYDRCGRFLSPP